MIDVPEGGGYLIRFYDGNGLYSPVFVPNLQVWADTIAASLAVVLNADKPVAVDIDTSKFTDTPQARPKQTKPKGIT